MTHGSFIVPLVRSLAIAPAARHRVALALAEIHDAYAGEVSPTMARIAEASGLSKVQARKHVHALISDGLLAVVGNAFGGAPGAGPSYTFNRGLLEHLAACNPDLFATRADADVEAGTTYRFEAGGAQFLACLVGAPGSRRVVFLRVDGELASFGDVPLRTLLSDPRTRGGWHCHLLPNGDPDVPFEQMFRLTLEDVALLANWAQNAALGRVESLVTT